MEVPPIITSQNPSQARDFRLRSIAAILIGVVGFWGPLWYDSRLPLYGDSRLGMVFILTLPFIFMAALWATISFKWAFRPRYLSVVLLLMAWSPILYVGIAILWGVFFILHGERASS